MGCLDRGSWSIKIRTQGKGTGRGRRGEGMAGAVRVMKVGVLGLGVEGVYLENRYLEFVIVNIKYTFYCNSNMFMHYCIIDNSYF